MATHLLERRRARGALAHRVLLALLTAALLAVTPVAASAHDTLTDSSPRDGEVLPAPTELLLTFSGEISPVGTAVELTGPDGPAPTGDPVVDGRVVTVPVTGDLVPGAYTVAWRVTSGDGHPISGEFGFEVEATEEPTGDDETSAPAETTAPGGTTTPDETTSADETTTAEETTTETAATSTGPTAPEAPEDAADEGVSAWVWVLAGLVVAGLAGLVVALARRES